MELPGTLRNQPALNEAQTENFRRQRAIVRGQTGRPNAVEAAASVAPGVIGASDAMGHGAHRGVVGMVPRNGESPSVSLAWTFAAKINRLSRHARVLSK